MRERGERRCGRKDRQRKIVKTLKSEVYNSLYQKVYCKNFILKSLS